MRSDSQNTLIGILRGAVEAWRKRERLSQMAVVDNIVETHQRLGLDVVSEIVFEDGGRDVYRRMQTNAERVYRWLDDQSKSTNLLPANFILSILAALPDDLRLAAANEILNVVELAVRPLGGAAIQLDIASILPDVAREGGEATASLADLVDGANDSELRTAQQQLLESIAVQQRALEQIQSALSPKTLAP